MEKGHFFSSKVEIRDGIIWIKINQKECKKKSNEFNWDKSLD